MIRISLRQAASILALICAGLTGSAQEKLSEAARKLAWQTLAERGDGFVIWESNRTGNWRLWRRNLDGSGLRQLSPNEKGRDHFCPHISPDGENVVYLSYPQGSHTYQAIPKGKTCPLRLITTDGTGDRVLADSARGYFEDRGAVWLDNEELIYIDGSGVTRQLNVASGKTTRLTKQGHKEYGFLLNRTKSHGVQGTPAFSVYDRKTQSILPRKGHGGCQPYFSHDGVWGFWTGGGGGPLKRIHLATGKTGNIIEKHDRRMPRGRAYLYFPMLSRCGRLFAFAASPDQHDHFKADYDIFIAASDPKTLELVGKPVRYSFDRGCDRFPDVYLTGLALRRHRGEAPYTLTLSPDLPAGTWEWHVDGRVVTQGRTLTHTFAKPGSFTVTARSGTKVLRGQITVDKAKAPALVGAVLRQEREIAVTFDEPIQTEGLKLSLDSGTPIIAQALENANTTLVITLGATPPAEDSLLIEGLRDRAKRPNTMPAEKVEIRKPTWPVNRQGLVFLWETANQPNLVTGPKTGRSGTYRFKAHGRARLNHNYAMDLDGGACLVEDADDVVLDACKETGELTIEAVLQPTDITATGPTRIITFSSGSGSRNFTLGQEKDHLTLRLRTSKTGANGTSPEVSLCPLSAGKQTHVIVTYKEGQIICYQDGKQVLASNKVTGDLSNWSPQHLLFGDEWEGGRDWAGTLEGIAIYSRALGPDEAEQNADMYQEKLRARKPVPKIEIQAKLLAKSTLPTLRAIAPYREAVACYEYEITSARPALPAKRVRVVHWVILDGKTLPVAEVPVGTQVRTRVEPFDRNPQLERFYQSDTLEADLEVPLFFAVGSPTIPTPTVNLEEYATWTVEPWADPVAKVAVQETPDRGRILRATFAPGAHGKTALSRPFEIDLSKTGRLLFDVHHTGTKPIRISCAFWTMPDNLFFESPQRKLEPGAWNQSVEIDLQSADFKSVATNWEYRTKLLNRERTVQLTFLIDYGKGAGKETVMIDRARLDEKQAARATVAPAQGAPREADAAREQAGHILGKDLDGAKILAMRDRAIVAVALASGTVQQLADFGKEGDSQVLSRPWWSADGQEIVFSRGAKAYRMKADGSELRVIDTGRSAHSASFWDDPRTGERCIVYMTTRGKHRYPENKGAGQTWLHRLKSGKQVKLADFPCDGGLSRDGTHLGEAYGGCLIRNVSADKFHILYDGKQACNATMSPDNTYRLMHLYLPHSYFGVRNKYDKELWRIEQPKGSQEWQNPRWSNHPDFCMATAKFGKEYKPVLVKMSTKETVVLKAYDGSWSVPHLWLPSAAPQAAVALATATRDPVDHLRLSALEVYKARLAKASDYSPIIAELQKLRDPEAAKILTALAEAGTKMLAEAQGNANALESQAIYRELSAKFRTQPLGLKAAAILKSPDFNRQVAATKKLEELNELAKKLVTPAGAKPTLRDPAFRERNRVVLGQMIPIVNELGRRYGDTAAATAAREMAATLDLPQRSDPGKSARVVVEVTILKASAVPTAQRIAPYTSCVTYVACRVDKVLSGTYDERSIVVVHWGMKDKKHTPAAAWQAGQRQRLLLDPFDSHRDLAKITKAADADVMELVPYWALAVESLK
jgi:hypothetical protein